MCVRSREINLGLLRRINKVEEELERRRKKEKKMLIVFVFIVMFMWLFSLGRIEKNVGLCFLDFVLYCVFVIK